MLDAVVSCRQIVVMKAIQSVNWGFLESNMPQDFEDAKNDGWRMPLYTIFH